MHDLPVLATAAAAYRLVAREIATVVRVAWPVLFIVALIQYFVSRSVLAQMAAALARQDVLAAAAIAHAPLWLTLKLGADAIGAAIVSVTLNELVLFGDRKSGQYFHLAFGWREAVFVGFAVVWTAVTVPFAAIVISPFGEPTSGLAPFVVTVLFVVVMYLWIRLWPVFAMIVAEDRVDIAGAWALTRRRFWSMFALVLLAVVPTGLLAVVIDYGLPNFDSLMDAITGPRETVPPLSTAVRAVGRAQHWLPLRIVLDFVVNIVAAAISAAIVCFAYLRLTGRGIDTPLEGPKA